MESGDTCSDKGQTNSVELVSAAKLQNFYTNQPQKE